MLASRPAKAQVKDDTDCCLHDPKETLRISMDSDGHPRLHPIGLAVVMTIRIVSRTKINLGTPTHRWPYTIRRGNQHACLHGKMASNNHNLSTRPHERALISTALQTLVKVRADSSYHMLLVSSPPATRAKELRKQSRPKTQAMATVARG